MNWGSGIGGGLSGAASGASIGSVVPGIGTAIGAGVGGLAGLFGGLFGNDEAEPNKVNQYSTLSPEQVRAQNAILQQVLSGLSGGPQGAYSFDPIRQQAESQFNQRTIPSIAQRFAGADAQRGSGFQQALGTAGAGLSENLAAQQSQHNLGYLGQLMQMLQLGLHPQFENVMQGGKPGGQNMLGQGINSMFNTGNQYANMYQRQQDMSELKKLFGGGSNFSGQFNSNQNDINSLMKGINETNFFSGSSQGSPLMNILGMMNSTGRTY